MLPGMAPELLRIDHIHVHVRDRAAAVQWYERTLGMTPLSEFAVWATPDGPLTIGDRSGTVHLALFQRPVAPSRSTIALAVSAAQFAAWRQHLRTVGVAFTLEDHQLAWSLYFTDPDDNPFEITTYEVGHGRV
ncbi:MAG: VOC family protein [Planctomycetes bacterium]|nr:VOC family protein [Planctomycetota bacterium]